MRASSLLCNIEGKSFADATNIVHLSRPIDLTTESALNDLDGCTIAAPCDMQPAALFAESLIYWKWHQHELHTNEITNALILGGQGNAISCSNGKRFQDSMTSID